MKSKKYHYYHGSSEQRVIEKIRLLFCIVNELAYSIIKQINKSEFNTLSVFIYNVSIKRERM